MMEPWFFNSLGWKIVEILPTLESESYDVDDTQQMMGRAHIYFLKVAQRGQVKFLRKGLAHKEEYVREACAKRLRQMEGLEVLREWDRSHRE
jgi:hypothetical protein